MYAAGVERAHQAALLVAAGLLFHGLASDGPAALSGGVALMLSLPLLRVAAASLAAARGGTWPFAAAGAVVFTLLVSSLPIPWGLLRDRS